MSHAKTPPENIADNALAIGPILSIMHIVNFYSSQGNLALFCDNRFFAEHVNDFHGDASIRARQ